MIKSKSGSSNNLDGNPKKSSQQPKVGKQLTEMLFEEARPSMTGDIDDVANLISPSPRRKPGKLHSANRKSNLLNMHPDDVGVSLDDSLAAAKEAQMKV